METFIRDEKGVLYRVIFRTHDMYRAERVSDRVKVDVPRNSATIINEPESFPGDWAIKKDK